MEGLGQRHRLVSSVLSLFSRAHAPDLPGQLGRLCVYCSAHAYFTLHPEAGISSHLLENAS